jgi:hypothetical protein
MFVGVGIGVGRQRFAGGFVGLLDLYPSASAAYSLRRLSSTYTGDAIRVRRLLDNAEQNIGFDALGNLDTTALNTFCSGTNGFVTTWYDQSGNGYNATQTTSLNQPQIVSSGSILLLNSKPCINFNGTTNLLDLPSGLANVFQGQGKAMSSFNVNTYPILSSQNLFVLSSSVNNDAYYYSGSSTTLGKYRFVARGASGLLKQYQSINNFTIGNQYLKVDILNLESAGVQLGSSWVNNILDINAQDYATTSKALNQGAIGALKRMSTAGYYNGNHQELIIYPTEQTSNRLDIQSNINSYYAIY